MFLLETFAAILLFIGGAFAIGVTFIMSGMRALKTGARWKGRIFVFIGLTLALPIAPWLVASIWRALEAAIKLV